MSLPFEGEVALSTAITDGHLPCIQAAKGGQAALPRPNAAATQAPPAAAAAGAKAKTVMPAPLRLDDQGREVDEQGRPIIRKDNSAAPALKVK